MYVASIAFEAGPTLLIVRPTTGLLRKAVRKALKRGHARAELYDRTGRFDTVSSSLAKNLRCPPLSGNFTGYSVAYHEDD